MAIELANAQAVRANAIATTNARRLLESLDIPLDEEADQHTPRRMAQALAEMTSGYSLDPAEILAKTFKSSCDEMVVVSGLEFSSLCAHHVMPFVGTAAIGYVPDGKVVGLSKLPRLLQCFALRLQIQEDLTQQIADALVECLEPKGVGVVLRASHSCMALRGVRTKGEMVTSALRGAMKEDAKARDEFMALALK